MFLNRFLSADPYLPRVSGKLSKTLSLPKRKQKLHHPVRQVNSNSRGESTPMTSTTRISQHTHTSFRVRLKLFLHIGLIDKLWLRAKKSHNSNSVFSHFHSNVMAVKSVMAVTTKRDYTKPIQFVRQRGGIRHWSTFS